MSSRRFVVCAVLALLASANLLLSQESKQDNLIRQIPWVHGPATADVGSQAKIQVPAGFMFTDSDGARRFQELMENIPSGAEQGVLAKEDLRWFVVFKFADTGYVKDDDKDSLDAGAMLQSIKEGTESANEERKKRGWGTVSVLDWIEPPHYSQDSHNLEWSLRARDDQGSEFVNHNTRYLGRRGVMSVSLVTSTTELAATLPDFRSVMREFSYTTGNNYQSFVKGDKVAEYGLTALVVGGAAAAAAKTGLLKSIGKMLLVGWKFVLAGIAALGTAIKRMFGGSSSSSSDPRVET